MMIRNKFLLSCVSSMALVLAILVTSVGTARADEGMWLPSLIDKGLIRDMRSSGMRLTAEDLYSVNSSSLKDAVVLFDGGCTGEMISDQGLLLTNHHCGYDAIQAHSTLQHDYLTNGFVAMKRAEELPNPGLKVRYLSYMKDVTPAVTVGVTSGMSTVERDAVVASNIASLVALTLADPASQASMGYCAVVEPLYYGNQYFIFVYQEFSDVRMVFAPPSSIGKFGGDTDNWMWPRHTGDFSIFRVYADVNGNPASFSKDNVPYVPKRSLIISRAGVQDGDFTFVYGFPGRTQEYIHSRAVYHIVNESNPERIALRTARLNVMNAAQEADAGVRIKYAAKNALVSNAWKKWQGESKGLVRLGTVAKKQELERQFNRWADLQPLSSGDGSHIGKGSGLSKGDTDAGIMPLVAGEYSGVTAALEAMYDSLQPYSVSNDYYNEALFAVEAVGFAARFAVMSDSAIVALTKVSSPKLSSADSLSAGRGARDKFLAGAITFYKDYDRALDMRTAEVLLAMAAQKDEAVKAAGMTSAAKGGLYLPDGFDIQRFGRLIAEDTLFSNRERFLGLLTSASSASSASSVSRETLATAILSDSLMMMVRELTTYHKQVIGAKVKHYNLKIAELYRPYMRGLMEMQTDRRFYPDANLTLRIAYGNVAGYEPMDAVYYRSVSTLRGVAQKDRPEIYDYDVPARLREVIAARDFGDYADRRLGGEVPVAFIATNHTTGGNSGSPVLDARGHLIGINFDRVWEGTMSDIEFDATVCRNIALDVRYVLFVVDKIGGAGYLLDEMKFAK